MQQKIELVALPEISKGSPEIVLVLDKIRFELEKLEDSGEYDEFCWFAREYPRCYRYHIECAKYRLLSIYKRYKKAQKYFEKEIKEVNQGAYCISFSSIEIMAIYWDFESYLSSINTALDILARIIGVAYPEQTPSSFNKLCKKEFDGPVNILKEAQNIWVTKMKDYRDCFTHYTPVDTELNISANLDVDKWDIRCKIPTNPNIRDILGFEYSKEVELLKYTISIYNHMIALDGSVANEIKRLYERNEFPKRKTNLFFLGERGR